MYEPFHHKYRPQTFAQLVGQKAIATTLTNAIQSNRIAPAYLFTGPRGTGKTSSARILAKSLNCLNSPEPTASPCGQCEVCRAIANGSALDVIEIDAASNTGVDNIREIIEKAHFAPVQCRYKVYVIDECLTGDSLILTSEGEIKIGDRSLLGKEVLSYNEAKEIWEYKRVVRWLERGIKPTLMITAGNTSLRCTANHLIRTDRGWIAAGNLQPGMRILSPFNSVGSPLTPLFKGGIFAPLVKGGSRGDLIYKGESRSSRELLPPLLRGDRVLPPLLRGDRVLPPLLRGDRVLPPLLRGDRVLPPLLRGDQVLPPLLRGDRVLPPLLREDRGGIEVLEIASSDVEPVYDLEVEDNHNFIANGLLVHNCHMLSNAAFNGLLKTLEEPPAKVIFVLATTDPQRVLPTIISRCQRFDYRRIPLEEMVGHLQYIAQQEKMNITAEAVTIVAQIANGGLRDAESLLDQLSLLSGTITVEKVWDLVGAVPERDMLALLKAIFTQDPEAIITQSRQLMNRGREPLVVLQNLASFYLHLAIAQSAPQRKDLVPVTEPTWNQLVVEAKNWQLEDILRGQQQLKDSEVQIKNTTQPRLWLEVTLLGLLSSPAPILEPTVTPKQQTFSKAITPISTPVRKEEKIQEQIDKVKEKTSPYESLAKSSPSLPSPETETDSPDNPDNSLLPSSLSKEEIWTQVLQQVKVKSPTAEALIRKYCHFIVLEDSVVRVGVKNKGFLAMVKEKLPYLEPAFATVCQRSIKVQLEIASESQPKTSAVQQPIKTLASPPPVIDKHESQPVNDVAAVEQTENNNHSHNNWNNQRNNQNKSSSQANIDRQTSSLPRSENGKEDNPPQPSPPLPSPPVGGKHPVLPSPPLGGKQEKETPLEKETTQSPLLRQEKDNTIQPRNYSDEQVKKAVDSLAQTFKGEVVTEERETYEVLLEEEQLQQTEPEALATEPEVFEPKPEVLATEPKLLKTKSEVLGTEPNVLENKQFKIKKNITITGRTPMPDLDDENVEF